MQAHADADKSNSTINDEEGIDMVSHPITRCPREIFQGILQLLVEDEAACFSPRSAFHQIHPTVAMTLSLVCKSWKDIVYDTPSLWIVISLNLTKTFEELKSRYQSLVSRAKSAPVDVYLSNIHSHILRPTYTHTLEECPSTRNAIHYFIGQIPNIRKLQIYGPHEDVQNHLVEDCPTSISTLREFVHNSVPTLPLQGGSCNLTKELTMMPRLVRLTIRVTGAIQVDFSAKVPALPALKSLTIFSGHPRIRDSSLLPAFLSHTPQIETLDFFCDHELLQNNFSYDPFTLLHLHTINLSNMEAIQMGFADGRIKTPSLTTVSYNEQKSTPGPHTLSFFQNNPGIRHLSINLMDRTRFKEVLQILTQLDSLKLDLMHATCFEQLLEQSTDGLPVLARVLRHLVVEMDEYSFQRLPLHDLVQSRCRPIDADRNTITGCRALDTLEIVVAYPHGYDAEGLKDLIHWKGSDVAVCLNRLSLRWEYKEESVVGLGELDCEVHSAIATHQPIMQDVSPLPAVAITELQDQGYFIL